MDMSGFEDLMKTLGGLFLGKYRGEVIDNEDPNKIGRLKIIVPNVMGTQEMWALPCVPYAGDQVGFFALPPIGSEIWVEFEGGDQNFPIWVGCLWGPDHIASEDASPNIQFWKSKKVSLRIDDEAGTLTLETQNGTILTIGDGEITLDAQEIKQSAGSSVHNLSASGLDVNNGAFSVS